MRDLSLNGKLQFARFSNHYSCGIDETQELFKRLVCDEHELLKFDKGENEIKLQYAPFPKMGLSSVKVTPKHLVNAHTRNDSSLLFAALDKPFDIIIENKRFNVTRNKVVMIAPDMNFLIESEGNVWNFILEIDQAYLDKISIEEAGTKLTTHMILDCNNKGDSESKVSLARLLSYISNEINQGAPQLHHERYLQQMEKLVASSIAHTFTTPRPRVSYSDRKCGVPRFVQRTIDYIHAHALESLSLQTLAKVAATTPRTLIRGFNKHVNCSPVSYHRSVRLQYAHDELCMSSPEDTSVIEIANKWGFYNPGRFAQIYKKSFGASPSQTLRQKNGLLQ